MIDVKLTKELALRELDNYFATAHQGCMPDDEDFKCDIQDCPEIFKQLRQIIKEHFKREKDREEYYKTYGNPLEEIANKGW